MRKGLVVGLISLLSIPIVFANTILESFEPLYDVLLAMFKIVSLDFVTGEYQVYAFKFFYIIALIVILQRGLKGVIKDAKARGVVAFSVSAIAMIFMPGDLAAIIGNQFGLIASLVAFMLIPGIIAVKSFMMWKENPHRFLWRGFVWLLFYLIFTLFINIVSPDPNNEWIYFMLSGSALIAIVLIFYGALHFAGTRNSALASGLGMSDKLSSPSLSPAAPSNIDRDLITANLDNDRLQEQLNQLKTRFEQEEKQEERTDVGLDRAERSDIHNIEDDEEAVAKDAADVITARNSEEKQKAVQKISSDVQKLTQDFNKMYAEASKERQVYIKKFQTYKNEIDTFGPLLGKIVDTKVKIRENLKIKGNPKRNKRTDKQEKQFNSLGRQIKKIQELIQELKGTKKQEIITTHDELTKELQLIEKLKQDLTQQTKDLQSILSGVNVSGALEDEKKMFADIKTLVSKLSRLNKTQIKTEKIQRHAKFFKNVHNVIKNKS